MAAPRILPAARGGTIDWERATVRVRTRVASAMNAAGQESVSMLDLSAGDTRVFLFHSPGAAGDPGSAMDKVNAWLGKDRSTTPYANLKIKDITVTNDGGGGIFTLIVCSLGQVKSAESGI